MSEAGSLYNIKFIQTTISSTSDMIAAVQAANNLNTYILVIIRLEGQKNISGFIREPVYIFTLP
jgi:hypothetical protein